MTLIDELTDPSRRPEALSREEYKQFLGEVADDLKIRLEAVEQEDGEDA